MAPPSTRYAREYRPVTPDSRRRARWQSFADIIALRKQQIAAVASIRNYSWLALSDSFPEAVIQQCQQLFNERVTPHRDHILNVISTLNDWK